MTAKTLSLRLLGALGLSAVFALGTASALVLHLNLPAGRRILASALGNMLDATLQGSFSIGAIERVGPSGLTALDVSVRDPSGRSVLNVARLRAQADMVALLGDIAFGGPKITLVVDHVHVTRADASVYEDSNTKLPTLVTAFTPKPPSGARGDGTASRHVRVAVRSIELTRAYARGKIGDLPLLEIDARAVRGWVLVTPFGAELSLSRFALVARGLGGADARGVASLHLLAPGWVWTSFDGYFGEVQVGSVVRVDGNHLALQLDLPRARPADVRALLPGYPLLEDAELHVSGAGELPSLALTGRIESGDSRVRFSGPVRLSGTPGATLEVEGERVDLRRVLAGAPPSALDVRALVHVRREAAGTAVEFEAASEPSALGDIPVPAADLRGALRDGNWRGRARLHEPGMPLDVDFSVERDGAIDLEAHARAFRIENVPRLAAQTSARGRAVLTGRAHIEKGRFSADLGGNLDGLSLGGLNLGQGTLKAAAFGAVDAVGDLDVDVTLAGRRVSAGELTFEQVNARARGPLTRPRVEVSLANEAGARIRAEATVAPAARGARVEALSLEVRRDTAELRGSVARLDIEPERVEVRQFELVGLGGNLTGSARVEPELVAIEARGRTLDLGGLSNLLGVSNRVVRGRLDLDADVVLARDVERGSVSFELTEATLGPVDGVTLRGRSELVDHRLSADLTLDVAHVGRARAEVDTVLAGSALERAAYRDMIGEARLGVENVDLTLLGHAIAPGTSIENVRGKLDLEARFTRRVPYALPSVSILGRTTGLELSLDDASGDGSELSGVDLRFGANLSGDSGDSDLSVQLVDGIGVLASASASATLDLARALAAPEAIPEQLMTMPVLGKAVLGERAIDRIPDVLQLPKVNGLLRAEATLLGSIAEPKIAGRVELGQFGLSSSRSQRSVDACATFAWERATNRVALNGEAFLFNAQGERCKGPRVALYSLAGTLVRPAPGAALRLDGSAAAALEGLPLDSIPGVGDAGIAGFARGSLSIADTARIPRIAASIQVENVSVRGSPVGDGKLEARSDDRSVGATLRLAQDGGEIAATVVAGLGEGSPFPTLDRTQPLGLRVQAKRANAAILLPLVRDVLSDIGGRVDADVNVSLPPSSAGSGAPALATGNVVLSDGTLQLAGLGLRLHDVELAARAETRGKETQIDVERLTGRAGRNDERVSVQDGRIALDGVRLVRAEGNINATELPILLEGVAQATATTRQAIAFRVNRTPTQMEVEFSVPYLTVALPQSAGRSVISLDENRSIELVQPIGEPRQRSEGSPWLLTFDLGQNVKITRSDLDLPLTGTVQVLLGDDTAIGGDLELIPGGRLDVSGKTFVIESGEVHFDTGDSGNPRIRVIASWRAPDGTVVLARVSGTMKNANLQLTSEPSRPMEEIYALLLGGSGTGDTGDPGAAGAGLGADRLLGPLLAQTPLSTVEFRAGNERIAEQRSYATYTAAVPISDKVWFEGSYKSSNSAQAGERDEAFSGTIDWRFRRNWSLRTEVGTIGTGVDLVWQYRY